MIPIKKGVEPPELKILRQKSIEKGLSPEEAYDTLKGSTKEIVRQSLLQEQGHLCAYCMCRIPRNDVCAGIAPIRRSIWFQEIPKMGEILVKDWTIIIFWLFVMETQQVLTLNVSL